MSTFEIPALLASPTFWFVVGGAVVAVAALLLIAIWWVARGIEKQAVRALAAAERIRDHTQPIWRLADTVDALEEVHRRVRSIAEKAETLAGAVHGEGGAVPREEEPA